MISPIKLGSILLALAIILGAFGAHALKGRLDAYSLDVYQKAVFYHVIHGFGIMVVGILIVQNILDQSAGALLTKIFLAGIIFFSGSLYLLAVTNLKWFGAITPIGGVLFIVGWILLAIKSSNGNG